MNAKADFDALVERAMAAQGRGQMRPVDAMIQSKKALAELTVVSGEPWITELSDAELRVLVGL
ncbi:putative helicase, SNF2/RAD54 family protein [Salinisphaera sp. PC39]|uniref:hypothetical protein n=1 Tax=Salinisphaera sp. PC39 TaxID=1304156 RepID=UPI0033404F9E